MFNIFFPKKLNSLWIRTRFKVHHCKTIRSGRPQRPSQSPDTTKWSNEFQTFADSSPVQCRDPRGNLSFCQAWDKSADTHCSWHSLRWFRRQMETGWTWLTGWPSLKLVFTSSSKVQASPLFYTIHYYTIIQSCKIELLYQGAVESHQLHLRRCKTLLHILQGKRLQECLADQNATWDNLGNHLLKPSETHISGDPNAFKEYEQVVQWVPG